MAWSRKKKKGIWAWRSLKRHHGGAANGMLAEVAAAANGNVNGVSMAHHQHQA